MAVPPLIALLDSPLAGLLTRDRAALSVGVGAGQQRREGAGHGAQNCSSTYDYVRQFASGALTRPCGEPINHFAALPKIQQTYCRDGLGSVEGVRPNLLKSRPQLPPARV